MVRSRSPDGWNHNTHYHDRLLQVVPAGCRDAMDIGCGRGIFARRLAGRCERVDAIDADGAVVEQARRHSADLTNLRFAETDFMTSRMALDAYDFVSMIAVLHHLPFEAALTKAAGMLRRGGVLAVLGLDRAPSLAHEAVRSAVACPVSRYYRVTRGLAPVGAAIAEPLMTLSEIREQTKRILPGAVVRRHILWRYTLVWTKR